MQNRLSYSFQTPISPEFFSLLLASYFSKKIAGKIDAALDDLFMKMHPQMPQYQFYPTY